MSSHGETQLPKGEGRRAKGEERGKRDARRFPRIAAWEDIACSVVPSSRAQAILILADKVSERLAAASDPCEPRKWRKIEKG
ncbi:MAG: hypothetical protein LBT86_01255 [Deltaproteobacteria bacterium]|nr:hypothetical protein [Deltaproteobacteria bacterium]